MYANGLGVKKSYKKAISLYKKAVKKGDSEAQNNLGFMYANGRGVKKNYKKTYTYWSAAAKQGNKVAQASLKQLCSIAPWACK